MSEFGKGLTYCLGLFLAHAERESKIKDNMLWFNGAADHLYELEVPIKLPEDIKKRLYILQNKSIAWRLSMEGTTATRKNKEWAIKETKDLLLAIDKFYKIPVEEAEWT